MPSRLVKHLLVISGFALLSISASLQLHPHLFSTQDSALYANIARNLLQKGTYTTQATLPLFYQFQPLTWLPYVPPITSLSQVPSLSIWGFSDLSATIPSLLFSFCSIIVLFVLGTRLFNIPTATFGSLLYCLFTLAQPYTASAMSEPIFTLLFLLLIYYLLNPKSHYFTIGLLLSLCLATKFTGVFLILVFFFSPILKSKRFWLGLSTYLLFLWFFPSIQSRMPISQHELWTLLAQDAFLPHIATARLAHPVEITDILSQLDKILIKPISVLSSQLAFYTQPFIVLFIFLALVSPHHRLKSYLIRLLVPFFVFHSYTVFLPRYFLPFIPPFLLLIASLIRIPKSIPQTVTILAILATILFSPSSTPPDLSGQINSQLSHTSPDKIIFSNLFAYIAWYTHTPSILIPATPSELSKFPPSQIILYPPIEPAWRDLPGSISFSPLTP